MALAGRILGMAVFLAGVGLLLATRSRTPGLWIAGGGILITAASHVYGHFAYFRARRRAIAEEQRQASDDASRPPT